MAWLFSLETNKRKRMCLHVAHCCQLPGQTCRAGFSLSYLLPAGLASSLSHLPHIYQVTPGRCGLRGDRVICFNGLFEKWFPFKLTGRFENWQRGSGAVTMPKDNQLMFNSIIKSVSEQQQQQQQSDWMRTKSLGKYSTLRFKCLLSKDRRRPALFFSLREGNWFLSK